MILAPTSPDKPFNFYFLTLRRSLDTDTQRKGRIYCPPLNQTTLGLVTVTASVNTSERMALFIVTYKSVIELFNCYYIFDLLHIRSRQQFPQNCPFVCIVSGTFPIITTLNYNHPYIFYCPIS